MTFASLGFMGREALQSEMKSPKRTLLCPAKCFCRIPHACPGV